MDTQKDHLAEMVLFQHPKHMLKLIDKQNQKSPSLSQKVCFEYGNGPLKMGLWVEVVFK